MTNGYYILQNKEAIPVEDILEWAKWFKKADRHVRQDTIGKVRISTVFLGLDHQWNPNGLPLLFETMIFGGEHDEDQFGYTTWEEAERGHEQALNMVKHPTPTPEK
jgi:hypothetical protein